MAFWLILAGVSVYPVLLLFPATSLYFKAPPKSDGYIADGILNKYFPQYYSHGNLVFLIKSQNGSVLDNSHTEPLVDWIRNQVINYTEHPNFVINVTDYYSLTNSGLSTAASKFLSPDGNLTMLMQLETRSVSTPESSAFVEYMTSKIKEAPPHTGLDILETGSDFLLHDFYVKLLDEVVVTDSITASIAIFVIFLLVRSFPLMIIPLANLIISCLLSFALLYLLTYCWAVATFVPAIILALNIAMTIDYSFFILIRLKNELSNCDRDFHKAISITVEQSGKVICVSGTTLAISFLGIVLLGIQFMYAVGVNAFLTLVILISCNLSFGPCLLLTFPNFFQNHCLCFKKSFDKIQDPERTDFMDSSFWYRLVKHTTTTKGALIVLPLTGIFIGIVMAGVHWFAYKDDLSLIFIDSLPSVESLHVLSSSFNPGIIFPFYITTIPKNVSDTFSNEYFISSVSLIQDLIQETNNSVSNSSVICMSIVDSFPNFDFDFAQQITRHFPHNSSIYMNYEYLLSRVYSPSTKVATMIVMVKFDPTGPKSPDFVKKAKNVFANYQNDPNFSWYLSGILVDHYEICTKAYRMFPLMLVITIVVIILFVTISMRSIVLPLRLIITIGITVVWTYGINSFIFCYGIFDKISKNISRDDATLFWLVPLMITSIIIGLGIDYDVFLFSRITEIRQEGKDTITAIRQGYFYTGSVITGAGLVMAIAFSGLAISQMPALRQIGFFLATSVLLDTFVVRMLIVPAMLYLIGRWNWWPSKLSHEGGGLQPLSSIMPYTQSNLA